jgi:nucleotide-binding universal stress UspA family protein
MLPAYKTILVATDFTENSDHAFNHAVMLARQHNAKIHLLHVLPQVDTAMRSYLSSVMGEDKLETFEKNHQQDAQAKLKAALDSFAQQELVDHPEDLARFAGSEVVPGNPVIKIIEAAKRLNADVIVIGTHSKGVLEHAFLGSIAEKVLQKANRPVFVIPLRK